MSPAATGEAATQISLEIAGTYSSESQTIYCPFSCVAAVQTELDGKITGDSLSATVRDNHELDEFRKILMRHFANVDPSGHQEEINNSPALRYQQFAITVHDETLRETLNALNRNLQTLYRLKPIFSCTEVMIGTAAGFFYIHIRRREFAIARSLGTKRIETVIMVFVEICLMFLVGCSYWNQSHSVCPRDCHPICHGRSTLFCYECRGNYSLLDGNWKKRNPITTGG